MKKTFKGTVLSGFFCMVPVYMSAVGHIDVVDGLAYYMWVNEDGVATANVQQLSEYFLNNGVPQYSGDVVIPPSFTYDGVTYTVDEIGYKAFEECEGLTSITIPSTIKEIQSQAFRNDISLRAVYIDDLDAWCNIKMGRTSYTNPLEYAHDLYLNGELITDLNVPDGVSEIGYMQFYGGSMKTVTLPEGVTRIQNAAFSKCRNLQSI